MSSDVRKAQPATICGIDDCDNVARVEINLSGYGWIAICTEDMQAMSRMNGDNEEAFRDALIESRRDDALVAYRAAFNAGDLDAMLEPLKMAETDAELEKLIFESFMPRLAKMKWCRLKR
jgi:hypothetical protein